MTTCGIDNIQQTLFLGCSIIDFSCSLGLNEQPTEVSVRLVEDSCASPAGHYKVYYDLSQPLGSIEQQWTAADPGFSSFGINNNEPPRLGAPVYFRVGTFEFMGVIQSWTKLNVQSDQNTYEVKLVTPIELLNGCQVIVGEYSGPIKGFNIFNVYGFHELFSSTVSAPKYTDPSFTIDGPVMGAYLNVFGGADINNAGMTWNKIKTGLQILTSNITPSHLLGYEIFSQAGRLVYFGGQFNGNFGLVPRDFTNLNLGLLFGITNELSSYYLDISEVPFVPDDYRIEGPSIGLLQLISQVCNDFGMDFYIEVVPVKDGGTLRKFIKVRTISRAQQPDTNIVSQYIQSAAEVVDSSFGRELRNENTTTFLVGGAKQVIWQVDQGLPDPNFDPEETYFDYAFPANNDYVRRRIVPFFGINSSGNAYTLFADPSTGNDPLYDYINLDLSSKHTWKILGPLLPQEIPVTISEMRQAEAGYDAWSSYSRAHNTYLNQTLSNAGYDIDSTYVDALNEVFTGRLSMRDLVSLNAKKSLDQLSSELRLYCQIIADVYSNSKKSLMVRVPFVASKYQIDSTTIASTLANLQVQTTDTPSDGGWTEAAGVLQLPNPGIYTDRLRLEDGRMKPFAMFDLIEDDISGPSLATSTTQQFDTEDSFAISRENFPNLSSPGSPGNVLYHTFQQDGQLVYLDRLNLISPRVVIRFSNPLDFNSDSNPLFGKEGWNIHQNQALFNTVTQNQHSTEAEIAKLAASELVVIPNGVAIALKSNSFVYGPWKPNNVIEAGPPGQIKFQKEEDLVPWQFGSMYNLDQVGQTRANSSVTIMTEGEVGNITIPGWPTIPLGAELASLQGLTNQFYPTAKYLLENRYSNYGVVTLNDSNNNVTMFNILSIPLGYWNGSYGPTITNINVNVSTDTITTTYSFRTYTPKFGVISKLNADRLERRFVQQKNDAVRDRFYRELKNIQNQYSRSLKRLADIGDSRARKSTPHSVLVGELRAWDKTIPATGLSVTGDGIYRRPIISTKSMFDLQNHMFSSSGYDPIAIMSLDGLVRPISLSGAGGLPRFTANATISGINNTASATPPFHSGASVQTYEYRQDINIKYLNPLANPSGTGLNYSEIQVRHTGIAGHDFDIIARGKLTGISGAGHSLIMPMDSGGFMSAAGADYENDYRLLALRGPLILQGWGYDTDGKPIPNSADYDLNIINSGIFATTGLSDKFYPDFLKKSHLWPVAPVDLRYDRRRNVWTAPPAYEFIVATLTEDIAASGSGSAVFNVTSGYNSLGVPVSFGYVTLNDKVGSSYSAGSKVIAYYDIKTGQYNIISAQGSGGSSMNFKIVMIDTDISGSINCTGMSYSGLNLYGYRRNVVDMKYYTNATSLNYITGLSSGNSCFQSGTGLVNAMVLATTTSGVTIITGTPPNTGISGTYNVIVHDTTPIFYDDVKPFILSSYTRVDYPNYPENDTFPPTGVGSNFFKKKYRGIAINDTLVTALCYALPAPDIP